MPEITIVIPVHNRAQLVSRTLKSVQDQTFRPLSVILVDNNSTDNTLETLNEWKSNAESPDFSITVLSEKTPGATAARNCGLRAVKTKYVMFFDSDDTMKPNHVQRAVDAFHSADAPDIVGWDVTIHDIHGNTFSKRFYATDAVWHCIMHGSMGTQRYAMSTALCRKAGMWNTDLKGWNDIELGIRLLKLNPNIHKIKGSTTVDIHQQVQSITGTGFSSTPQKWEASLDAIERSLNSGREKRYVRLRRALLAGNYAREGRKAEADRLMQSAIATEPSALYRMLMLIAHRYTAAGGRAAARILRPLF